MDYEIHGANDLLLGDLTKFFHFTGADYGFDDTIETLIMKWFHPLMLAANTRQCQWRLSNIEARHDWPR